jgi:hypothetical protein
MARKTYSSQIKEAVIIMSKEEKSLYEQMGGTYTEIDGIFYPNITLGNEAEEQNDFCGKYGDMWKKHMHDNRNADYRYYLFTGKLNEKAKEINEQAYEMLDVIMNHYMNNHKPDNPKSTIEMWKLRELAKMQAEEVIFHDIIFR